MADKVEVKHVCLALTEVAKDLGDIAATIKSTGGDAKLRDRVLGLQRWVATSSDLLAHGRDVKMDDLLTPDLSNPPPKTVMATCVYPSDPE